MGVHCLVTLSIGKDVRHTLTKCTVKSLQRHSSTFPKRVTYHSLSWTSMPIQATEGERTSKYLYTFLDGHVPHVIVYYGKVYRVDYGEGLDRPHPGKWSKMRCIVGC